MSRILRLLLAALYTSGMAVSAEAYIVDTGPDVDYIGGRSLSDSRPNAPHFQNLAGMFSLQQDSVISSVEGWMNWYAEGMLTFSIHANNGGVPGSVLYSTSAQLHTTGLHPEWRGAFGLNWELTQGQYWVVFEDVPGDPGVGAMPDYFSRPTPGVPKAPLNA